MTKSIALMLSLALTACVQPNSGPSGSLGSPYQLSETETYIVRDYVSSEFHLPRAVRMHPMNASQSVDGQVTVCGLADAIGQEGPGEPIGYRAYTGVLIPQKEVFVVTGLADTATEDKAIRRLCDNLGAPIIHSDEVKRFMHLVKSG